MRGRVAADRRGRRFGSCWTDSRPTDNSHPISVAVAALLLGNSTLLFRPFAALTQEGFVRRRILRNGTSRALVFAVPGWADVSAGRVLSAPDHQPQNRSQSRKEDDDQNPDDLG